MAQRGGMAQVVAHDGMRLLIATRNAIPRPGVPPADALLARATVRPLR